MKVFVALAPLTVAVKSTLASAAFIEDIVQTFPLNAPAHPETFASNVKELVQGQDEELDRLLFRIILTVRKSNYEKSAQLLEQLKEKVSQIV